MSALKKIIASLLLLVFSFSVFANNSWYKKNSSWHTDAQWYSGNTSWYSYEYHWKSDGIKLDNQKEFVNELSKFISSKVQVSEVEKEKKLNEIYAKALKKFAIGTAVIAVEVVLYTFGGPVVSAIALCSLKGSTSMAVSGALAGGAASIFYSAAEGDDFDTIISKSIDSASDGYMVGAIIGGTIGGVSGYKNLKDQIQSYSSCGYDYDIDELGRPTHVSGKLRLEQGIRNKNAQLTAGGIDRLPTDDGGHLIATQFGGSGELDNLVPMSRNLNRGKWEAMENSWAKALRNGGEVYVDIKPQYAGKSSRPKSFRIEEIINGVKNVRYFLNT